LHPNTVIESLIHQTQSFHVHLSQFADIVTCTLTHKYVIIIDTVTVICIRDTVISCTGTTYVMSLPVTLDTVVSCCFMYISTENHDTITTCSWPTDVLICYFTGYRYTDTLYTIVLTSELHRFTGIHAIDCFCISVAWFTAPVTWISDIWIFMYSCYIIYLFI